MTSMLEELNKSFEHYPFIDVPLTLLSKKVKCPKILLAAGGMTLLVRLASSFGTGHLLIDFIGLAYLLVTTAIALEKKDTDSFPLLLSSWMTYTAFKFIEAILDDFLSSIPFYIIIKVVFLTWCLSPVFKGAHFVHKHLVRPIVLSKEVRKHHREGNTDDVAKAEKQEVKKDK